MARGERRSGAEGGGRETASPRSVPLAEWIGAGLGALAALFLIGSLAWQAIVHEETPPDLSVRTLPEAAAPAPAGAAERLVPFVVENAGGRTAAEVAVVARIAAPGEAEREIIVVFDYVPRGSEREGAFVVPAAPDVGVTLAIGGWREP